MNTAYLTFLEARAPGSDGLIRITPGERDDLARLARLGLATEAAPKAIWVDHVGFRSAILSNLDYVLTAGTPVRVVAVP